MFTSTQKCNDDSKSNSIDLSCGSSCPMQPPPPQQSQQSQQRNSDSPTASIETASTLDSNGEMTQTMAAMTPATVSRTLAVTKEISNDGTPKASNAVLESPPSEIATRVTETDETACAHSTKISGSTAWDAVALEDREKAPMDVAPDGGVSSARPSGVESPSASMNIIIVDDDHTNAMKQATPVATADVPAALPAGIDNLTTPSPHAPISHKKAAIQCFPAAGVSATPPAESNSPDASSLTIIASPKQAVVKTPATSSPTANAEGTMNESPSTVWSYPVMQPVHDSIIEASFPDSEVVSVKSTDVNGEAIEMRGRMINEPLKNDPFPDLFYTQTIEITESLQEKNDALTEQVQQLKDENECIYDLAVQVKSREKGCVKLSKIIKAQKVEYEKELKMRKVDFEKKLEAQKIGITELSKIVKAQKVEYEKELKTKKVDIEALKVEKEEMKQMIQNLQRDPIEREASLQEEIRTLSQENGNLSTLCSNLQEQVTNQNTSIQSLNDDIANLRELTQRASFLEEENQTLRQRCINLEVQVTSQNKTIESMRNENADLRRRVSNHNGIMSYREFERIQEEVSRLNRNS